MKSIILLILILIVQIGLSQNSCPIRYNCDGISYYLYSPDKIKSIAGELLEYKIILEEKDSLESILSSSKSLLLKSNDKVSLLKDNVSVLLKQLGGKDKIITYQESIIEQKDLDIKKQKRLKIIGYCIAGILGIITIVK